MGTANRGQRPRGRSRPWTLVAALAAGIAAGPAWAGYPLEVIDLRARFPEEVIPTLKPLAGPDGVVTGSGHSLFLRVAPDRLEDIRRALERIDTPARSLLIQVRRASSVSGRGSGAGVSVDEPVGDRARIRVGPRLPGGGSALGAGAGQGTHESRISQEVRALDGRPAFIASGSERPEVYREGSIGPGGAYRREGVAYRRAETGFYVTPRVNGDRVTLDIAAFAARPGGGATQETGEVQTSVTARLGDWVPIGGVTTREERSEQGLLYQREGQNQGQTDLELRVIELP